MPDSLQPHGLQPTRLLRPWDFPGKSTGVGCHCLLWPTSAGSWQKQENSRKTCTSASLTALKLLTVWITTNCGKFFKRWEYQTTLPASREICMLVKKQQLELDMEQQTGSKLGAEYLKAVYCHPAYLTSMQSAS